MKKIKVFGLVIILMLFSFINIDAYENDNSRFIIVEKNSEKYLLDTLNNERTFSAYVIDEKGDRKDISLEELLLIKNTDVIVQNNEISEYFADTNIRNSRLVNCNGCDYEVYSFQRTSLRTVKGSPRRVSDDYNAKFGNVTISVQKSITVSQTWSLGASGSASIATVTPAKKAMTASLSGGYSSSISTGSTVTGTHTVPKGSIGYLSYTPYLKKSVGNIVRKLYSPTGYLKSTVTRRASTLAPATSNGHANGLYEIKIVGKSL